MTTATSGFAVTQHVKGGQSKATFVEKTGDMLVTATVFTQTVNQTNERLCRPAAGKKTHKSARSGAVGFEKFFKVVHRDASQKK